MFDQVWYHRDEDGFGAAWVASRAIKNPMAKLTPVDVSQAPPASQGLRVLLVHCCYPLDAIRQMINEGARLTLIGQHPKYAEDLLRLIHKYGGKLDVVFDPTKSPALLTWEFFYPGQKPPMIVDYLQDVGKWKLPDSQAIHTAIRSYPLDLLVWDTLEEMCEDRPNVLLVEGHAILRYQAQAIRGTTYASPE